MPSLEYGAIDGRDRAAVAHESAEAGVRPSAGAASASQFASVVHGSFQDAHAHPHTAVVAGGSNSAKSWARTGLVATGCAAVLLCIGAVAGGLDGLTSSSSPGLSADLHGAAAQRTGPEMGSVDPETVSTTPMDIEEGSLTHHKSETSAQRDHEKVITHVKGKGGKTWTHVTAKITSTTDDEADAAATSTSKPPRDGTVTGNLPAEHDTDDDTAPTLSDSDTESGKKIKGARGIGFGGKTSKNDDDYIPDPSKTNRGRKPARDEEEEEIEDYNDGTRMMDGYNLPEDDAYDPDSQMFLYLARKDREPLGVCMDGTQPAFWYRPGFGEGADKWLIHLKGGGWCISEEDCADWVAQGYQAGSGNLHYNMTGRGIMSINPKKNPNYFNWNMVYAWYCDGGSYVGHHPDPVKAKDSAGKQQKVYFRGTYVFSSIIKTLKYEHDMKSAADVVLVGTSAGALGVMHQCGTLMEMYDEDSYTTNVGCIMDAGFFYESTNFGGQPGIFTGIWNGVAATHRVVGQMNSDCENSEEDPNKCFLADTALKYITHPLFMIQSSTDYWQLKKNFFNNVTGGLECMLDPVTGCTPQTWAGLQSFHSQTLQAISAAAGDNEYVSWFLNSCFAHAQVDTDKIFNYNTINGTTISQTLDRWFNASKIGGDATRLTRATDPQEWPHKDQGCAWGPSWDAYVTNHSWSLEFGDSNIWTGSSGTTAELSDDAMPDNAKNQPGNKKQNSAADITTSTTTTTTTTTTTSRRKKAMETSGSMTSSKATARASAMDPSSSR